MLASCLGMLKYNFKFVFARNFILGLFYLLAIPFFINVKNLNFSEAAQISEYLLPIPGIIIFNSIIEVDYECGTAELVTGKAKPVFRVILWRFLAGAAALILGNCFFLYFMSLKQSTFDLLYLLTGATISGIYLGLIGISTSNLAKNSTAGYLMSLSYFLLEFITKSKYTWKFELFSLTTNNFVPKLYLLAGVLIMIGFNLLLVRRRSF